MNRTQRLTDDIERNRLRIVRPRLGMELDEDTRSRERKQTAVVVTLICLGAFALVELAMLFGLG